jgi:hypothetical protein
MIGYVLVSDSGKCYIGITTSLSRRVREHRASGPLSGKSFVVAKKVEFPDRDTASAWEVSEIERLGIENLLNTSLGGFGGRKRVCTEAERKVLSEKAKARYQDESYRVRMSEASKKAWASSELREKMSVLSKDSCSREETKAARSASQKASWADPAIRAKRIEALRANRNDPAKKEKRRAAAMKMWEKRRASK